MTSTACKHRVSGSISLPFRGSFNLSLTVLYAIGHQVVFSLGRWSSQLQTEFHVFRPTLELAVGYHFSPTGLSPSTIELSSSIRLRSFHHVVASPQPRERKLSRFGLFPFRSPLLWESIFLSLPSGT